MASHHLPYYCWIYNQQNHRLIIITCLITTFTSVLLVLVYILNLNVCCNWCQDFFSFFIWSIRYSNRKRSNGPSTVTLEVCSSYCSYVCHVTGSRPSREETGSHYSSLRRRCSTGGAQVACIWAAQFVIWHHHQEMGDVSGLSNGSGIVGSYTLLGPI